MRESKPPKHHWTDFFVQEFAKETDRACVILAAAMIEQALDVLIRTRLVPTPSQEDPLLDGPYAPLATFSAKIEASHRLGIISPGFARDLHLIRRIRNEFAHNVTGCDFTDASVRSRIAELARSVGIQHMAPALGDAFQPGPKGELRLAVAWCIWFLWAKVDSIDPLKPGEDEPRFQPPDADNAPPIPKIQSTPDDD
jgi:DNA-binding MltR family transcriptional regulator